jgi:hypothetical protein
MMNRTRLLRISGLAFVMFVLVACSLNKLASTSTPSPIPGIDKPIILENIRVKYLGNIVATNIELRLLNAYTEESLDADVYGVTFTPRDIDNIFLILDLELSGHLLISWDGLSDWIYDYATLICGKDEYKAYMHGCRVGDGGKYKACRLIMEAPRDADFGQCVFHIKEYAVELTTFFK